LLDLSRYPVARLHSKEIANLREAAGFALCFEGRLSGLSGKGSWFCNWEIQVTPGNLEGLNELQTQLLRGLNYMSSDGGVQRKGGLKFTVYAWPIIGYLDKANWGTWGISLNLPNELFPTVRRPGSLGSCIQLINWGWYAEGVIEQIQILASLHALRFIESAYLKYWDYSRP